MRDWKKWGKAAAVRAVKTMAQTFVASVGSAAVISAVDWRIVVSSSILAGILSVATSIAGLPEAAGPGHFIVSRPAVFSQHVFYKKVRGENCE